MRAAALLVLRTYQQTISPYLPTVCRFEPTCSHYSHGAISRHGVFKGLLLSARRLVRCHPWGKQGYDPVP